MTGPSAPAQVQPLTVRLLGPIDVWRNGSQILDDEWERHQTKWLLAFLLSRPGAVFSYDRIIDALFEEADPQHGRRNLYSLVSRLRRTLQPDLDRPAHSAFILRHGEGYSFNTKAPFSLDTLRFEALIKQATSLERNGRLGEAGSMFQEAADLYRDDYLSENRYADWTLDFRQSLREQLLRALEGLANCQAKTERLASAISTSERLIRLAPHREQGYRLAMYYSFCAGSKEKAELAYRECVRQLKQTLNAEPSQELMDLREQILSDTAPRLDKWIPHNLPTPLTSFIGRKTEIAELCDAVRSARLVTLLGPGGIGKTRLAIEVGARIREEFRDGAWIVDLGALSSSDQISQQMAKVLEVRFSPEQEVIDVIEQQLRPKSVLLILDTCERAIDSVASLAERLLQACPRAHILATSREALNVRGEVIRKLLPLGLPEMREPAMRIATSEAVQLFAERTRLGLPGFKVTEQNAETVACLCRKLDGLPLALELAASQARAVPINEILHRVEEQSILESWGFRTSDARLASLKASVAWSYDVLPPSHRAVLKQASVFESGFDLEAACAVLVGYEGEGSSSGDCLRQLEEKSLVVFDATPGAERYSLLDSIRAFGMHRLAADGEVEVVRDRHLTHFRALAHRASMELSGPLQAVWHRKLFTDLENFRAALQWALDSSRTEDGLELTCDLCQLWTSRNLHQEGLDWTEAFLAQGAAAGCGMQGRALWLRSRIWQHRGLGYGDERSDIIRRCHNELSHASRLFDEAGDRTWWARCQVLLANNTFMSGSPERARAIYENVLKVNRQIGNRRGETACLANLARIHLSEGKADDAFALLEEALSIAKKTGNLEQQQNVLVDLGNLHESRGSFRQAWRLWQHGVTIARERGDRHGVVQMLVLLAIVACDQNWEEFSLDVSESYWSQAMQVARDSGNVNDEVRVLVNHGAVLQQAGKTDRARSLLTEGLHLSLNHGSGAFAVPLTLGLAEVLLVEGDAESAALLMGAVRSRHYALLDEQLLHQSEIAVNKAVRKALGSIQADAASERGARMGLRATVDLLLAPSAEQQH